MRDGLAGTETACLWTRDAFAAARGLDRSGMSSAATASSQAESQAKSQAQDEAAALVERGLQVSLSSASASSQARSQAKSRAAADLVGRRHKGSLKWRRRAAAQGVNVSGGLVGKALTEYVGRIAEEHGFIDPAGTELGKLFLALNAKACLHRRLAGARRKQANDAAGSVITNSKLNATDGKGFDRMGRAFGEFRSRFFDYSPMKRDLMQPYVSIEPAEPAEELDPSASPGAGDATRAERFVCGLLFFAEGCLLGSVQFAVPVDFVQKRHPPLVMMVRAQKLRFSQGPQVSGVGMAQELRKILSMFATFMIHVVMPHCEAVRDGLAAADAPPAAPASSSAPAVPPPPAQTNSNNKKKKKKNKKKKNKKNKNKNKRQAGIPMNIGDALKDFAENDASWLFQGLSVGDGMLDAADAQETISILIQGMLTSRHGGYDPAAKLPFTPTIGDVKSNSWIRKLPAHALGAVFEGHSLLNGGSKVPWVASMCQICVNYYEVAQSLGVETADPMRPGEKKMYKICLCGLPDYLM